MAILRGPPCYRSYLLTIWEERNQDPVTSAVWRFSLGGPRTGQRRDFASLEALVVFLRTELVDDQDELISSGGA